jgi:hypothetical protein
MKTRQNKKAQGGKMLMMVAGAITILIIGGVMVTFMMKLASTAPAKAQSTLCANTMQLTISTHDGVDKGVRDAILSSHQKTKSIGVTDVIFSPRKSFGNYAANRGKDAVNSGLKTGFQKMGSMIKDSVKPVCSTSSTTCRGDAAEVSRCLHERTADTYYALLGGAYHEKAIIEWQGMTLYEISIRVTKPGKIKLKGGCSDYIKGWVNDPEDPDNLDVCDNRDDFDPDDDDTIDKWLEPCGDEETSLMKEKYCNLQFGTVDGTTIALTGIADCSKTIWGPLSPHCLCYPKEGTGNKIGNGIRFTGRERISGYTSEGYDGSENKVIGLSDNNEKLNLGKIETWSKLEKPYGGLYPYLYGCGDDLTDLGRFIDIEKMEQEEVQEFMWKTPYSGWWQEDVGSVNFPNIENTRDEDFKVETLLSLGSSGIIGGGYRTADCWKNHKYQSITCGYYAAPIIQNK